MTGGWFLAVFRKLQPSRIKPTKGPASHCFTNKTKHKNLASPALCLSELLLVLILSVQSKEEARLEEVFGLDNQWCSSGNNSVENIYLFHFFKKFY